MTAYNVDFNYSFEEVGSIVINADDPEQAEQFGLEYLRETYPEAHSVVIDNVREIN